jgi:hypothetical protein
LEVATNLHFTGHGESKGARLMAHLWLKNAKSMTNVEDLRQGAIHVALNHLLGIFG